MFNWIISGISSRIASIMLINIEDEINRRVDERVSQKYSSEMRANTDLREKIGKLELEIANLKSENDFLKEQTDDSLREWVIAVIDKNKRGGEKVARLVNKWAAREAILINQIHKYDCQRIENSQFWRIGKKAYDIVAGMPPEEMLKEAERKQEEKFPNTPN